MNDRRRANISQAEEFLIHAVKYLFPPELGGETRGCRRRGRPSRWPASLRRRAICRRFGPTQKAASAGSRSRRCITLVYLVRAVDTNEAKIARGDEVAVRRRGQITLRVVDAEDAEID